MAEGGLSRAGARPGIQNANRAGCGWQDARCAADGMDPAHWLVLMAAARGDRPVLMPGSQVIGGDATFHALRAMSMKLC